MMRNPFTEDIFSGEPTDSAAGLHEDAMGALSRALEGTQDGSMGRALVITAPRAGFGKSHLVTRFAQQVLGEAIVVPLTFDLENEPRWQSVFWAILTKMHRDHGHRAGLTLLDEAARYLFARVNSRLIQDRKIPCVHPTEAIAALERNYVEMFDFSNHEQAVARWFGEQFERLTPLTSESLAPEAGVDPQAVAFWLRALLAYSQGAEESPEKRLESLKWAIGTPTGSPLNLGGGGMAIIQETGGGGPEATAKDRLRDAGRLLGMFRPIVFVVDHLDVFYRDGRAGLKIAYFVSELRRLLPRSLTLVCVNQDLWDATFRSQLPSALEDRLSGGSVALRGMTPAVAGELIVGRLTRHGVSSVQAEAFLARCDIAGFFSSHAGRPVSARAVLRHAAACWEEVTALPPSPEAPGNAAPPIPLGLHGEPVETESATAELASFFAEGGPGIALTQPVDWTEPGGLPVVGSDTLDSISEALARLSSTTPGQGTDVDPAPPPPSAPPAVADSRAAFKRLKERIELMRQRILPGAAADEPEATPAAENGAAAAATSVLPDAATQRFRAHADVIRRQSVQPGLDFEQLAQVLRFVGQHFPAVRSTDLDVPGSTGQAVQWLSADAEVIFGLESDARPTFWSALTAHASARAKQNGGLPVKIVVFPGRPGALHPAAGAWQPQGGAFTLDLVEPAPEERIRLTAAALALADLENGKLETTPAALAACLARELESFWRRVTRLPAAH